MASILLWGNICTMEGCVCGREWKNLGWHSRWDTTLTTSVAPIIVLTVALITLIDIFLIAILIIVIIIIIIIILLLITVPTLILFPVSIILLVIPALLPRIILLLFITLTNTRGAYLFLASIHFFCCF